MGFLSSILDLLFPPKCVFCTRACESTICELCEKNLPYTENGGRREGDAFEVCVSPLHYTGNVRKSLLRFKFRGSTAYADTYGRLLAKCIHEQLAGRYDIISWVPLSQNRARSRGYDQAMLLALATALELGDVAAETLIKTHDVRAQSLISDRESRRENISGAYKAADPELIAGKSVLLIDDIVTTGSTLSECARTLKEAGAEKVFCAALASTDYNSC